jgi:hypothetical protein
MRSPFVLALLCLGFASVANAQDNVQLQVGGATIDISFDQARPAGSRKLVLDWIVTAAEAVRAYYTKFPVPNVAIAVNFHDGEGVNAGRAFGWEHAHISISVGVETTAAKFADDWTMMHEMVHLASPSVPRSHHWIEEGLATYVEPIARARAGDLTPEKVWGDMVDAMPQGLPKTDEHGLDFTHTWGRTYWGGALYCLLADVEIRKRTGDRVGLEDAMRGILKSGGSIEVEWPLACPGNGRSGHWSICPGRTYNQMRSTPVSPDLDQLWNELGVKRQGKNVAFDDSAPLAAIRRAITASASCG